MRIIVKILSFLLVGSFYQSRVEGMDLIELAQNSGAQALVNLIKQAGLTNTIKHGGNFTIFAPVDSAFTHTPADALRNLLTDHSRLADVLKYHVVSGNVMSSAVRNDLLLPSLFSGKKIRLNDYDSGRVVTATGSKITQVDLQASNGVIHLIDRLMYPIPEESALQYLASKPNFTQLAYNAIRANIATELQGGPLTIFAPLDAAFYALPAGYLNDVFLNMTHSKALMNYHIVKGTFYSAGLRNGENIQTMNGKDVRVRIKDGGKVMIENANVLQADISITNGVIHVIDQVLLPENHVDLSPVHEIVG